MQKEETLLTNDLFFAEVKKLVDEGKSVRMRVRGGSMLPFIRNNDIVRLIPASQGKIRKGTVVVAQTDELGYVMHRIVQIEGERITLLGDGNVNRFEHTDRSRILAIATHYERGGHIFATESFPMRLISYIWYAMHPWRKDFLNRVWQLKTKLFN